MRHLLTLVLLLVALLGVGRGAEFNLAEALERRDLTLSCSDEGTGVLQVSIENRGGEAHVLQQPAGLICATSSGSRRAVTLRAARIEIAAGGSVEASIPVAALSWRHRPGKETWHPTNAAEPRLAGLLAEVARDATLPRLTAELVALCLIEDVTFPQWQEFVAAQRKASPGEPTPADTVTAVDALGLLRKLAPDRRFALAADSGLRLRALRNPWSRAKASQLFGLEDPSEAPPAVPPNLETLLHTKLNDNCPICRQRSRMAPRDSDP